MIAEGYEWLIELEAATLAASIIDPELERACHH
jgi:hypothetical protein